MQFNKTKKRPKGLYTETPPKKATTKAALVLSADDLGAAYEKSSAQASTANKAKEEISKAIKESARQVGEQEGQRTVIKGKLFEVGFTTVTPTFLCRETARKILPSKLYSELVTMPEPELSEKRFLKAVDDGRIPVKLAQQILKKGAPQERVYVGRTRKAPRP